MKDLYAVLLQKERDIQRLRHEIEAIRYILPLLADDPVPGAETKRLDPQQDNRWPLEVIR